MEGFHRFMAQRGRQSGPMHRQKKVNQQGKEASHQEDYIYLMEEQNVSDHEHIQPNLNEQNEYDADDPLDAFMKGLQQNNIPKKHKAHNLQNISNDQPNLNNPNQCSQSDENQSEERFYKLSNQKVFQESDKKYFQQPTYGKMQRNVDQAHSNLAEEEIYDNDFEQGNGAEHKTAKRQKKIIETLKPFDFTQIELEDFEKNFYQQHCDIARLTQNQIKSLRKQFEIKVFGQDVPRPIISFGHLQFHPKIKDVISKQQFEKPTPIQCQALPIALSGRDLIGVAKTGSGKTLAYVWPMITHVSHQRQAHKSQGPVGLVLAPTRELCQQIYLQTKKYTKRLDIKIGCLLGGENKHEQWKMLRAGVDILIASPGRLIEMIKKKATNMQRVTYLVLDEADKMLSLGFEHQIRSIVSQTRPDRQTLLFTATMKQQIQFLAYDILQSPIRIICGDETAANENVKQEVVIFEQDQQKLGWFRTNLDELLKEGKLLIFCNHSEKCEELKTFIEENFAGTEALTLYGDKSQYERTVIMNTFKGTAPILIATDIASRGIDVKAIKTVINFQCPKTIESYIHRIGRAGRAGQTGTAISFLIKKAGSIKFAIQLIKIFQNSGYPVSKELEDLAFMDEFYRRKRISSKMGVSFAKGKDASKFLNQILKQQQRGNSKAGIGMSLNQTDYKKNKFEPKMGFNRIEAQIQEPRVEGEKTIAEIIKERNQEGRELSIYEISKMIREQKQKKDRNTLASQSLKSHFVKSSQNEWNL